MSDSRLEKFIYAICSMDVSDLPVPLSRIEKLWNCLITGETPDFEPLSRNEKYLMAMLDRYDISNLPAPMSRGEKLLYKIAVGETDLSDVPGYLSRYEELLKYLSGGDFEYVLYTLNQSLSTLYTTAEKPVKSAILKGSTKYRDIDTGEFLETFEDGRNLELVSVKMPVLTTTGKNLFDKSLRLGNINTNGDLIQSSSNIISNLIKVDGFKTYSISGIDEYVANSKVYHIQYDGSGNLIKTGVSFPFTTASNCKYIRIQINGTTDINGINSVLQIEQGSMATSYEPHKSNILLTPEDLELRGIGDVCDELDCLTGKVTERIGNLQPIQLTVGSPLSINSNTVSYSLGVVSDIKPNQKNTILSNALPQNNATMITSENEGFYTDSKCTLVLVINKSRLTTLDKDGLLKWLTDTSCEIIYTKSSESIKTVDLTVVDQDNQSTELGTFENVTRVSLEAENLIPEVEMEVATRISEELASASPLMDDISTEQQQLEATVDEQSNNVDATMIATTEIYEETL